MKEYGGVSGIMRNTFCTSGKFFLVLCIIMGISSGGHAASPGGIFTLAGGWVGDNGAATSAILNTPYAMTVDSAGNLYIADKNNHRIRKVAAGTGTITTVAGNGWTGFNGDGGAATAASLYNPSGIAVDIAGNLYIADTSNHRIRKVDTGGTITTVAGNGTATFGGDNGAATAANLYNPTAVTVDSAGNLFIADKSNHRIRKVAYDTNYITTVAGSGTAGFDVDNVAATSAKINNPTGVTVDSSGNLYIADFSNHRIRKVDTGTPRIITTVAGSGTAGFDGDNGDATLPAAKLNTPYGVAVDSVGNLYISDVNNMRIRKVDTGTPRIITTVAGNGTLSYYGDGGAATSAALYYAYGVAVDSSGNIYIADSNNNRIRKVDHVNNYITTVAGNGTTCYGDGGQATSSGITPTGVALDSAGNLYIADKYNNRIRKVTAGSGIITTVAGNGNGSYAGDDIPATTAQFQRPSGVALGSGGDLYIADYYNMRIRKVDYATQIVTTVAGNGTGTFGGDNGAATAANLNYANGVAVDSAGNLYIADSSNNRIRKVDIGGTITTMAGNGTATFGGDNGTATAASLKSPQGVALDSTGNLYVADTGNHRIRKVDTGGTITTVAGNGTGGSGGDGGAAISAQLNNPGGVTIDSAGNLFIADTSNQRIRKVTTGTGIITTVAGNSSATLAGDSGPATSARLYSPSGVTVDSAGNLYIADSGSNRIRKVIKPVLTSATITYSPEGPYSAGDLVTITATFNDLIADATPPKIALAGANTLAATSMTKVDYTHYTYIHTVTEGNNSVTVSIPNGVDINGVALSATPSSGVTFSVITLPPTVATGAASAVTTTGATLNGTASPNGAATTVTFNYGLTTDYGSTTTASQSPLAATAGNSSASAAITGLACNTVYQFRVVGANSAGTSNSPGSPFTTSACPAGITVLNYSLKPGSTFTVYRSQAGAAPILIYSGTMKIFTDDTSLFLPNTIYKYTVASDSEAATDLLSIRPPLSIGWNIIGVPYATTGIPPSGFFSRPITGAIYEWVPTNSANPDNSGHYITVNTLAPGKGYFVLAGNSSITLAYSGAANPASVDVILKPGYTLITNTKTTNMTSIGTTWLIDGASLDGFITAIPPKIGGAVYWWNGTNYDSWNILDAIPANRPTIEPWKAYWILNKDTINHTLTIQ